jgi:hypothetical protein
LKQEDARNVEDLLRTEDRHKKQTYRLVLFSALPSRKYPARAKNVELLPLWLLELADLSEGQSFLVLMM